MSSVATIATRVGYRIGDAGNTELPLPTDSTSITLAWMQEVVDDAAKLTDCLQGSATIAVEKIITVVNYAWAGASPIAGCTITITRTTNGASVGDEGTGVGKEWDAVTSNNITATNITTWLNTLTGVGAFSSGAVVYVYGISDSISALTTTCGTSGLTIAAATVGGESVPVSVFTRLWRILSLTDRANEIVYLPVERRAYQGFYNNIVGNSIGGMYVYNLFGFDSGRQLYVLPILVVGNTLTLEYSQRPATILWNDTALPGLFDWYDNLVIEGIVAMYWAATGDFERYQHAFASYMDWVGKLAQEVGTNPVIKPEMSSLYRYITKAMKEVKGQ